MVGLEAARTSYSRPNLTSAGSGFRETSTMREMRFGMPTKSADGGANPTSHYSLDPGITALL